MHLLPFYGKIMVSSETVITEHLAGEVAKLHVKTSFVAEIISHGFKEETEHPVAIHTIVILAFAVRPSMPVDKGREESPVTENAYEHMSHNTSLSVLRNSHAWFKRRSVFHNAEHLLAMKEITAVEVGQIRLF